MTEQILPILLTHASRPKTAAERVLQVMYPHVWQVRANAGPFPCGSDHPIQWSPLIVEDVRWTCYGLVGEGLRRH